MQNPGFETFSSCPEDYVLKPRKELIPGWYMPTSGTADYFNICAEGRVGVPKNFMGYCYPNDGVAYAGIILLLEPPLKNEKPENYREYLQARFNQPLERGKNYEVSLYFSVSSYSTYSINRLGVYLSKEKPKQNGAGVLKYKPHIEADSINMQHMPYEWIQLKGTYKAAGGERYLTLGNFYDDFNTQYMLCDFTDLSSVKKAQVMKDRIAYYYIDTVSVIEKAEE